MTAAEATRLATQDADAIIRDANTLSMDLQPGERRVIVDGSQYSPSHRAIPNGERVYQAQEGMSDWEAFDAYTETLDARTDDWSSPNGACLVWEDGMLVLEIPREDER